MESGDLRFTMPIHDASVINDPDTQWIRLRQKIAAENRERLDAAFYLAARVHYGQVRKTEEGGARVPYIVHPLRVARIVAEEWQQGAYKTLAACLLHDTLEDAPKPLRSVLEKEIDRIEGREVLEAVHTLTKPLLPKPCPPDVKAARDARYFSQLRAAPDWVRLIKCADRVDNLRDARAWGQPNFWARYCSETIGWHLYLARETSPVAEAALFKELVAGEREIRGRAPVWADGHLIDPVAAASIPEHIARDYGAIGLALRGETLLVGLHDGADTKTLEALRVVTGRQIEPIPLSKNALRDALTAGLYGPTEATSP
jgi:hypothetical protein